MSFLERAAASIGIGAAKVDTVVQTNPVRVGDTLSGYIHIRGGNVEQQIDKIYLNLMTYYIRESNDHKVKENVVIKRVDIMDAFTIAPRENRQIPFSFTVPFETPVSLNRRSVWLHTGLDIKMALDPNDNDYIEVLPHPYVQCVLDIVKFDWGFNLYQCEHEHNRRHGGRFPFVQEFEFRPGRLFRGQLDELEMVFYPIGGGLEILMEVDRKARGLGGFILESLDLNESIIRVHIPGEVFQQGNRAVSDYLYGIIQQYV